MTVFNREKRAVIYNMVAYWSWSLMRSGCCERVEVEEVVFFQKVSLAKVLVA